MDPINQLHGPLRGLTQGCQMKISISIKSQIMLRGDQKKAKQIV